MATKKESDLTNEQTSVNPFANTKTGGTMNQNPNQSDLTQQGNQTKGNTPGGNFNETRHTQANKPRSNPQGNSPMSIDTNSAKKGPGKKAN
ncbi:hypothetical protein JAO73_15780 [Hymenobacter sp. BT523]|uniref:hypothetical protein n=1 Tax=Hymenobacter sp. BT523 TaxID=2795725 RepID=UPI0018ED5310|nr:hypothetical protein [Hymenobacter sp. BT523]MBJ6110484.1 hypothetical protein [Hymenobacter sp. BT523]